LGSLNGESLIVFDTKAHASHRDNSRSAQPRQFSRFIPTNTHYGDFVMHNARCNQRHCGEFVENETASVRDGGWLLNLPHASVLNAFAHADSVVTAPDRPIHDRRQVLVFGTSRGERQLCDSVPHCPCERPHQQTDVANRSIQHYFGVRGNSRAHHPLDTTDASA
jgi:hypothetical protein